MTTFRPPINSRATSELISIKHSSTDYWQQEAIDQAKTELIKRGVTREEEERFLDKKNEEIRIAALQEQKRLERNAVDGYDSLTMAEIMAFAPLILLGNWHTDLSLWELRQQNYKRKFKQRLALLISGLIIWVLIIRFNI